MVYVVYVNLYHLVMVSVFVCFTTHTDAVGYSCALFYNASRSLSLAKCCSVDEFRGQSFTCHDPRQFNESIIWTNNTLNDTAYRSVDDPTDIDTVSRGSVAMHAWTTSTGGEQTQSTDELSESKQFHRHGEISGEDGTTRLTLNSLNVAESVSVDNSSMRSPGGGWSFLRCTCECSLQIPSKDTRCVCRAVCPLVTDKFLCHQAHHAGMQATPVYCVI